MLMLRHSCRAEEAVLDQSGGRRVHDLRVDRRQRGSGVTSRPTLRVFTLWLQVAVVALVDVFRKGRTGHVSCFICVTCQTGRMLFLVLEQVEGNLHKPKLFVHVSHISIR